MGEKKVIIVESPTKAKTIRNFLGSDCTVVASNGHVRTLPKNDLCIDVKNGYRPKYIIDETKEKIISQIRGDLKGAQELILATDEDREGESISWHLVEVLKPSVPYRRMVFHEITKKAILEAFGNGRDLDMNLVHAQEARRVLDRLYGYTISPVLWSKLSNKSLSAGRVQSPGLRLIVDREKTRLTFRKSEYWDVKATFSEGFSAAIESVDGDSSFKGGRQSLGRFPPKQRFLRAGHKGEAGLAKAVSSIHHQHPAAGRQQKTAPVRQGHDEDSPEPLRKRLHHIYEDR